jgi:hypothetical protein
MPVPVARQAMPCPICNATNEATAPRLLSGFKPRSIRTVGGIELVHTLR